MAILNGTNRPDTINGTAADDTVNGNNGNDVIYGASGSDVLNGGKGDDYIEDDWSGDDPFPTYGNDMVFGGEGQDGIFLLGGNDTADGGLGNDTIYSDGGTDDLLIGNAGNDYLVDDSGADIYRPGAGNDTIDNGWFVGDGADTFIFEKVRRGFGTDVLDGYDQGTGEDRIEFAGYTAADLASLTDGPNGAVFLFTDGSQLTVSYAAGLVQGQDYFFV